MTTKVIEQSVNKIKTSVEKIKNNKAQMFPEAASVGDFWRQGDVLIELIEKVPSKAKKINKPNPQVAPGYTKGSRHILNSLDGVTMYSVNGTELDGPIIELKKECTLTHPEHGDVILPSNRIFFITFERQYDEEIRRQAD